VKNRARKKIAVPDLRKIAHKISGMRLEGAVTLCVSQPIEIRSAPAAATAGALPA
jgi:hypothetical protein